MEVRPECVPCLMKRVLFQAKLAGNGTEFEAVSEALAIYPKVFSPGANSARVATEVHKCAYSAMGVKDPYQELKIRADEVAGRYIPIAEVIMGGSANKTETALKVAAVGNIMDFGSGIAIDTPEDFVKVFNDLIADGIDIDERAVTTIECSKRIVYLFDNCGETQMDKVLLRHLRAAGKHITGVVRGEPILNDVTLEDAGRIGLDKEVDEMMTTGMFAIGLDLKRSPSELKDAIADSDLIISKGMGNYEALSSETIGKPIVYVLRTKCIPVAESIGAEPERNVVKLFEQ